MSEGDITSNRIVSKVNAFERQLADFIMKVDSQSLGQVSEQRVQQMVIDEVNSYTKSLSENMK